MYETLVIILENINLKLKYLDLLSFEWL